MRRKIFAAAGDDYRAHYQERRENARKKKQEIRRQELDQIKQSDNPIETAFELWVPGSGAAKTNGGELVRAMTRIMYRDYNDGDVFYEGYGIETCGEAVHFLCDITDDRKIYNAFEEIAARNETGDLYTKDLEKVATLVMNYIYD